MYEYTFINTYIYILTCVLCVFGVTGNWFTQLSNNWSLRSSAGNQRGRQRGRRSLCCSVLQRVAVCCSVCVDRTIEACAAVQEMNECRRSMRYVSLPCLIPMSHSHVSLPCVTPMSHSHVSLPCLTHMSQWVYDMPHSCVRKVSLICMTCLTHMWKKPKWYVWHVALVCMASLTHTCGASATV